MKETRYLEPTQEAGLSFAMRRIAGEFVRLNLLRFRHTADYSATTELASSGIGHRIAALEDSRLLPLVPVQTANQKPVL
jgi:hypothetical protein